MENYVPLSKQIRKQRTLRKTKICEESFFEQKSDIELKRIKGEHRSKATFTLPNEKTPIDLDHINNSLLNERVKTLNDFSSIQPKKNLSREIFKKNIYNNIESSRYDSLEDERDRKDLSLSDPHKRWPVRKNKLGFELTYKELGNMVRTQPRKAILNFDNTENLARSFDTKTPKSNKSAFIGKFLLDTILGVNKVPIEIVNDKKPLSKRKKSNNKSNLLTANNIPDNSQKKQSVLSGFKPHTTNFETFSKTFDDCNHYSLDEYYPTLHETNKDLSQNNGIGHQKAASSVYPSITLNKKNIPLSKNSNQSSLNNTTNNFGTKRLQRGAPNFNTKLQRKDTANLFTKIGFESDTKRNFMSTKLSLSVNKNWCM